MAERNPPADADRVGDLQALFEKRLMLGMLEQPAAREEMLLRRVEADELEVAPDVHAIEQAGIERRLAGRFVGRHPLAQEEVVEHLRAVVAILGLGRVVIADARIDRNAVQQIAIRLIEREEPVVVFVAVIADRQAENAAAGVDVVAGRQHEAHVVLRRRRGASAAPISRCRFVGVDLRMPTPKSPMIANVTGPSGSRSIARDACETG